MRTTLARRELWNGQRGHARAMTRGPGVEVNRDFGRAGSRSHRIDVGTEFVDRVDERVVVKSAKPDDEALQAFRG